MSYRKQNFTDGQILKAEHLNYIESAIEAISDGVADPTDAQVHIAVQEWLGDHPEATTSVADGSISTQKLADGAVTLEKTDDMVKKVLVDCGAQEITWTVGKTLNSSTGVEESNAYCAVSSPVLLNMGDGIDLLTDTVAVKDFYFGIDGTAFLSANSWTTGEILDELRMINAGYYRFVISLNPTDTTTMTTGTLKELLSHIIVRTTATFGIDGSVIQNGSITYEKLHPDTISQLSEDIGGLGPVDEEQISQAVNDWLDEHPEATTTVADGSITYEKLHSDVINQLSNEKVYVTPQMFGAVADGVADDTVAIQAALDAGGKIYFPAGRYKVTRQLTATKSCKISMFKPYPTTSGGEDYPKTDDDNWMGARIETSATDGYGLLIGEGVEVDGLFMRAMKGFSGVLFKFDGALGCKTYPSQTRLSHIYLDCVWYTVIPESMFDFVPQGTYFHILDDIVIGSLKTRQFSKYGFRSVMTTSETNWANSVRIRNLCVDILADYSFYIDGGERGCCNWVFENMSIQSYPYDAADPYYNYKTGHIDLVTLKNVQDPLFLGCWLWDLHAASITGKLFNLENAVNIACFGCCSEFDEIEMALASKLKEAADHLNIKNLEMLVEPNAESGANDLILSDGIYERRVSIPAAVLTDEQMNEGISVWFEENARPSMKPGRNKFDPLSIDTVKGYPSGVDGSIYTTGANETTSNYIEVEYTDVVRISKDSVAMSAYLATFYDENKNFISQTEWSDTSAGHTVLETDAKYLRLSWSPGYFSYADRIAEKICVTVNNTIIDYEEYKETVVGGIGSFVVLQSPNGIQYTIGVDNEGNLVAIPVDGYDDGEVGVNLWNLSDRTPYKNGALYYIIPTDARLISADVYVLGVTSNGYWNSAAITDYTIDGENITLTRRGDGFGIGVPVLLKTGCEYTLTVTSDVTFTASISFYDAEGVWVSENRLLNCAAAGTHTVKTTVGDADFYILVLYPEDSDTATFTDISLMRAE